METVVHLLCVLYCIASMGSVRIFYGVISYCPSQTINLRYSTTAIEHVLVVEVWTRRCVELYRSAAEQAACWDTFFTHLV